MNTGAPSTLLARELPGSALDTLRLPGGDECPRVRPEGIDELRTVLQLASSENWSCLILGKGSRLGWQPAPARVDLAISTEAHRGLVSFEPGDGTLTARAGTSMDELNAATGEEGYHLTPDIARPADSTLGGVLGAGCSGFDRLRYGPVRHHVLGMQVMLADGSLAKTGGRLVKNVTGYDLQRLYCGSRGSLCVILEATLRLFPAPEKHAAVRFDCENRAAALRSAAIVSDARIHPLAVVARPTRGTADPGLETAPWELFVFLAGREKTLDGERERLTSALGELQQLSGVEEKELRSQLRDSEQPGPDACILELSTLPSQLNAALEVALGVARERGLEPAIIAAPLLAQALVQLPRSTPIADLEELQHALARIECTCRWRDTPTAFDPRRKLSQPAVRLMRELRRTLDPHGRFATGSVS